MNAVKHAVLDAARLFLGLITACSNACLTPLHGVTSPWTALWNRGNTAARACSVHGHHEAGATRSHIIAITRNWPAYDMQLLLVLS